MFFQYFPSEGNLMNGKKANEFSIISSFVIQTKINIHFVVLSFLTNDKPYSTLF